MALERRGITASTNRRDNGWDTAPRPSETLFGSLKFERLYGQHFGTIRQAEDETIAWLHWYNPTRLHSALSYVSPMKFEQDWNDAMASVA
jgi:putative transposase